MHRKVILELDPALLKMMGYQDLLSKIEYIEGTATLLEHLRKAEKKLIDSIFAFDKKLR